MKRILMSCAFALTLFATSALADDVTGVITCSKCKHTDASAAKCAKTCIKNGVAPILVSSDGKTYKIANPDKVGDHVLEQVTVTGAVENDTITIESVMPAKS
jgi:methylmalonyl-CoA mutase cobalamin-binding subunit